MEARVARDRGYDCLLWRCTGSAPGRSRVQGKDPVLNRLMGELALIIAHGGVTVEACHVWSEQNAVCDSVSRGGNNPHVLNDYKQARDSRLHWRLPKDIGLCGPPLNRGAAVAVLSHGGSAGTVGCVVHPFYHGGRASSNGTIVRNRPLIRSGDAHGHRQTREMHRQLWGIQRHKQHGRPMRYSARSMCGDTSCVRQKIRLSSVAMHWECSRMQSRSEQRIQC